VLVALTHPGPADALDVDVLVHAGGRQGRGSAGRLAAGTSHVVAVRLDGLSDGPLAAAARVDWRPTGAAPEAPPLSRVFAATLRGGGLRLEPEPVRLGGAGAMAVRVSSLDGRARRVRLDVVAPMGLLALSPPEFEVPATGAARVEVALARGSAPRGSAVQLALQARSDDAAGAALARVELLAEPGSLPTLRPALVAAALALLGAAALAEWRSRRRQA
jgi:hypothetical protein